MKFRIQISIPEVDVDDDLVSYWDILHPPPPPPEPVVWDSIGVDFSAYEIPSYATLLPHCITCGLPFRLCTGQGHLPLKNFGGRISEKIEAERRIFDALASRLIEEEKQDLRRRIVLLRRTKDPTLYREARVAALRQGKIPLPMWRIDMFRQVFYGSAR